MVAGACLAWGGVCLAGLSLTSLFLYYSGWEMKVQKINFWCFLNLSDRGSPEQMEFASSGLACSQNVLLLANLAGVLEQKSWLLGHH